MHISDTYAVHIYIYMYIHIIFVYINYIKLYIYIYIYLSIKTSDFDLPFLCYSQPKWLASPGLPWPYRVKQRNASASMGRWDVKSMGS